MKVLVVMDRLNVGGPARMLVDLVGRFETPGCEIVLATGDVEPYEETLEPEAVARGLDVRKVPGLGREIQPRRDVAAFRTLLRLIRDEAPDVVHTHKSKAGVLGRLAARRAGVPAVIHTFHGHVLDGYFSPARTRIFRAIERGLARITDRIVVLTRSQRDELLAYGIGRPEQYHVLPCGADLARYAAAASERDALRTELGLPPAVPIVGIVGRLVAIKAHEVFLAAAARLAKRVPEVRFVLVGDGDRRTALEGLAGDLGIRARTYFLGSRGDLPRLYPGMDVVALSSLNEGLPLVLLEAMAAGRPVVATAVGGVPDVVQDGVSGLLVPPRDPERLAAALARLLDDPGLAARLAARGRADAARYDAARLAARTRARYDEVAATPVRGAESTDAPRARDLVE